MNAPANFLTPFDPAKVGAIMEAVLIKGDLSALTQAERAKYYVRICESLGLNPMTRPFKYILLNGELQLYALKACTDQLRAIHRISVTALTKTIEDGIFIVTADVAGGAGRTDADIGAVPIANLKGEALCNAMMKASTKAKRRATLSICGLGFLDETEMDDIPAGAKQEVPQPEIPAPAPRALPPCEEVERAIKQAATAKTIVRTIVPAPKHSLKNGGIADRALQGRIANTLERERNAEPSKPFLVSEITRRHPIMEEPPPHDDIPDFLDRRQTVPA